MTNEYPKYLVKKDPAGTEQLQDGNYASIIVNSEQEEEIARADGYAIYGEVPAKIKLTEVKQAPPPTINNKGW